MEVAQTLLVEARAAEWVSCSLNNVQSPAEMALWAVGQSVPQTLSVLGTLEGKLRFRTAVFQQWAATVA